MKTNIEKLEERVANLETKLGREQMYEIGILAIGLMNKVQENVNKGIHSGARKELVEIAEDWRKFKGVWNI